MQQAGTVDPKDIALKQVLGYGSFGTVHCASWSSNNEVKIIAVKRFHQCDNKAHEQINKEVKLLACAQHENIIKLYGISLDVERRALLLMEYAENGSLYKFLHESGPGPRYSKRQTLNWMQQCAKGLSYLHAMQPKVIHRDLKTQNLLLTNAYRSLKICDFGTVTELATLMTTMTGTANYMAPEVAYNQQSLTYSEKCDVYSFGIVLWESMSRKKPYYHLENKNPLAIVFKAHEGERPILSDIKQSSYANLLKTLITSCWAQNPAQRPTMQHLVEALKINTDGMLRACFSFT